mmetsp:Transcript_2362/g.7211  ORF Transcript_2362/g.7211 Transcript_2362/m.7211 type:complete len:104 (-) Transcript_2362:66-377(-)
MPKDNDATARRSSRRDAKPYSTDKAGAVARMLEDDEEIVNVIDGKELEKAAEANRHASEEEEHVRSCPRTTMPLLDEAREGMRNHIQQTRLEQLQGCWKTMRR